MRLSDMNWMQVEEHVKHDQRAVLPIGSTEQHGYLSLCVDVILSERVSIAAAEPIDVPVYPTINYGFTPSFVDYAGTVSLSLSTLCAMMCDILDHMVRTGFRQIVIVNGHGGNGPAHGAILEWLDRNRGVQVKWHNWWSAPLTMAKVKEIDPLASHASWMENLPWTRLPGVAMPDVRKPMIDIAAYQRSDPAAKKQIIGDGNFGGLYQRPDADVMAMWDIAVAETRALIETDWN